MDRVAGDRIFRRSAGRVEDDSAQVCQPRVTRGIKAAQWYELVSSRSPPLHPTPTGGAAAAAVAQLDETRIRPFLHTYSHTHTPTYTKEKYPPLCTSPHIYREMCGGGFVTMVLAKRCNPSGRWKFTEKLLICLFCSPHTLME